MIILTKSIISLMLGFIVSIVLGIITIPILKKCNFSQKVSKKLNERHLKKEGTPTIGGTIFIIATLIIILLLYLNRSIEISLNFILIIMVFILYGALGFIDDYLKIKFSNNAGISIITKFLIQVIIAILFFYFFIICGNSTVVDLMIISIDLKWCYGLLMLFMLVGTSNAVNITDGLDGLAAGLSAIAFLTYGIIAFNSSYIIGYQEIAVFCFVLSGALLGFLTFNFYPAKVFMGDMGSLSLGATLCAIAIILKLEVSLIIIGFVFIVETLSSFIQIIAIRKFNKKIFLKSPFHHHLEELNFNESDIIKMFYTVGLICAMVALIYFVWL